MAVAAFIGDSFVRRFADDKLSRVYRRDVDFECPDAARLLAVRTGFTQGRWCRYLYTISEGINLIKDLRHDRVSEQLKIIEPRVVLLNMSTNNLARLPRADQISAESIAEKHQIKVQKGEVTD